MEDGAKIISIASDDQAYKSEKIREILKFISNLFNMPTENDCNKVEKLYIFVRARKVLGILRAEPAKVAQAVAQRTLVDCLQNFFDFHLLMLICIIKLECGYIYHLKVFVCVLILKKQRLKEILLGFHPPFLFEFPILVISFLFFDIIIF